MPRLIIFLAALAAVVLWVRRLVIRPPATFRATPGNGPRGRMVRDRVCNTYLPEPQAMQLSAGEVTHYFCSRPCRERFLAARSGSTRPAAG